MCEHCSGSNHDGGHVNPLASAKNQNTLEQLITEIRSRLSWIGVDFLNDSKYKEAGAEVDGKSVRLLDYACGSGFISRALDPYVTQVVGIDISPQMVHEYNTWAGNQSSTSKMAAFVGNLLDPDDPSPTAFEGEDFHGFDLAVVGLGFHNFDPVYAATSLAERLMKGSVLVVVDLFVDDGPHNHGHRFGHHHGSSTYEKTNKQGGFGEEEMKAVFDSAGVGVDFGFEIIARGAVFETPKHSMMKDIFIARGTKA